jgi:hypothetical protein
MTTHPDYKQKLADILSLLNPPQQDYDVLADEAWRFLKRLPSDATIERALATYFELFASGYAYWQQTYDYPRIHEYFYGGYLKAKEIGGSKFPELVRMLENMTKAMIAYTNCENALVNGDSQSLFQASQQALEYGKASHDVLPQQLWESSLFKPLDKYLQMNLSLWRGFNICARGYLDAQEGKELSDADRSKMEELLGELKSDSHELFSEVNAHYSFVQRHSRFRKKITSSIRLKQGHLFLRAIGYIGEKEVSKLFEKFEEEGETNQWCQDVQEITRLPIESIRAANMMDIFETALGEKYLAQLIFELSPDEPVLSLYINDEEKEFDMFRVCIARFGVISVEFGLPLKDVPISEVRTLESVIGPHAGRLKFVWKNNSSETEGEEDVSDAQNIDFVEYFLYCQQWFDALQKTKSQEQVPELAPELKLATGQRILEIWEKELSHLADLLERKSANAGEDKKEDRNKSYASLLTNFRHMYNFINNYPKNTADTADPIMDEIARKILLEGKTFGQLMDIAEIIIDRLYEFMKTLIGEEIKEKDIRYLSRFDCNVGWQSILECNQLVLVEADGKELEPNTEAEYRMIMKQPEFKGLAIQSREARSAIDDWIFVDMPQMRNLGPIRSHENDVLYVGTNKIFLWFPDDPDFLVNQYVETCRLIGNIRTLVLTFNDVAKKQVDELEELLDEIEGPGNDRNSQHKKNLKELLESGNGIEFLRTLAERIRSLVPGFSRQQDQSERKNEMLQESKTRASQISLKEKEEKLVEHRNGIEVFRAHAERILDLLRAFTISKYQDHGELMKWMLQESKTSDLQIALEKNIENLDRFHGYLSSLLHQRIAERNQANQTLIAVALFILTCLSGLSAIPALYSFLYGFMTDPFQKGILVGGAFALLSFVIVGCLVAGLIFWQRSRNI